VSVAILFLLSSVRFFNNADNWLADILSHFPFQYALISLALMFLFLGKKSVPMAVVTGFLFLFNMSAILDLEESIHAAGQADTSFKIYSANINKDNREFSNLNREVKEIDPDIVLLLEVKPGNYEQLHSLMQAYSYRIKNISPEELGFVFLSKFPMHGYNVTKLSKYGNSLFETILEINEKPVMFYGIHAQRPRFGNYTERVTQSNWLAREINGQSLPVIVAGDFNSTPYSPVFRDFVKTAGLKDSREGFGWQPSWPAFFPPLWIPIDHVLVTPDIQVRKRTTGSYISSDHYPVIAELSLN
jgi:endonuclease/exonuclease/phosphatase (EEP) superfamily protein YafD